MKNENGRKPKVYQVRFSQITVWDNGEIDKKGEPKPTITIKKRYLANPGTEEWGSTPYFKKQDMPDLLKALIQYKNANPEEFNRKEQRGKDNNEIKNNQ